MKLRKRIMALALGLIGCVSLAATTAFAAEPDLTRKSSLTVVTELSDGTPVKGVKLHLYKVGDLVVKDTAKGVGYELTGAFKDKDLKIDVSGLDVYNAKSARDVKTELSKFVKAKNLGGTVKTTAEGSAEYDDLASGLYFVTGDPVPGVIIEDDKTPDSTYVPDSVLVALPAPPHDDADFWDHVPTANMKYGKGLVMIDPPVTKNVVDTGNQMSGEYTFTFLLETVGDAPLPEGAKIAGEGSTARSYSEAVVKASKAGSQEVEFGEIWYTEPGTYNYVIKEDQADKSANFTYDDTVYEMKVEVNLDPSAQGNTKEEINGVYKVVKTITNKKTGESKTYTGVGNEPVGFNFTNTYKRTGGGGGHPSGGGSRKRTPGGSAPTTAAPEVVPETTPEPVPGVLPKTGMLWWPVPVLAVMGMFLFAAGFILDKRRD